MDANKFQNFQDDLLYIFADKTILLTEPRLIRRHDGGSGDRYYYIQDLLTSAITFYVSTTTWCKKVLPTSPFLMEWMKKNGEESDAKRDTAAEYGTLMHICLAEYLMMGYNFSETPLRVETYLKENGLSRKLQREWCMKLNKAVASFAAFCREYEVEPILIEGMLGSDELGIAGTIDLICYMTIKAKRYLAQVDFKSGNIYESSELQLMINQRIFEENFPHLKIEKLFNWSPKDWLKEPTYTLKDQTKSIYGDYTLVDALMTSYIARHGDDLAKKKVFSFSGTIYNDKTPVADFCHIKDLAQSVADNNAANQINS
jgi:hypothetical protein